jgi:hypothetical protein
MSRGLGALQRALLEAVQEHGLSTFMACRLAYKIEPTDIVGGKPFHLIIDAQHSSVRRALAGLAKQGLIVNLGRRFRDGRARWCTPAYALAAR